MLAATPLILITDDDDGFRETLRLVFEPQGFRTIVASDGQEAVEIVRSCDVHVVLMDMHMPRLTGLETIEQVKRFKESLPCILMSAAADDQLVRQAMQIHAYTVLRKPVSRDRVTSVVHTALQRTYSWFQGNKPSRAGGAGSSAGAGTESPAHPLLPPMRRLLRLEPPRSGPASEDATGA